jgi:hypothetical protein
VGNVAPHVTSNRPPPPEPSWRRVLLSVLLWPFKLLLALLILFEEWGWEPLQALLARIGAWPGFRVLEAWVRRLPPYAALALFALPALALLPVKLLALWLIGRGKGWLGALIIVATKLVGTAVVARLFTLTQPALMRLGWFARFHARWAAWKARLLAQMRASWAWQAVAALAARIRAGLRALRRWLG